MILRFIEFLNEKVLHQELSKEDKNEIESIVNGSDKFLGGEFIGNSYKFDFNTGDDLTLNTDTFILSKNGAEYKLELEDEGAIDDVYDLESFKKWIDETDEE